MEKKVIYVKHESEIIKLDTRDGFIPLGCNYVIKKHPDISLKDFHKENK